ncbi:MAG: DUF4387 domain-containing protein [Firmicutes bacterium]|nr:DUF4387 domain-containing protein [Bacillota bacterium]
MKYRLRDLASVIRSKNSGPFELTLDVIFKDRETFERVASAGIISKELISKLYHVTEDQVLGIITFPEARAIKATIVRPMPSGALGERDVYGAQQHAPLMDLEFDM